MPQIPSPAAILSCLAMALALAVGLSRPASAITLQLAEAARVNTEAGRTIELTRAESGHLLLPVTINGTGPFTFILDTGASHTAIAQPVVEALGFESQWVDFDPVQSINTRFDAERFVVDALALASFQPVRLNSVVIPVAENHPLAVVGLIGADAMIADRYEINVEAARLSLGSPALEYRDGTVDHRGLMLGMARLRQLERPIHVLIDTGSAQTLVNPAMGDMLQRPGFSVLVRGEVHGVAAIEGEEAEPIRIRSLQVGGLCIDVLDALEADLGVFEAMNWDRTPAIVIGMDMLRHARLRVDRRAGAFELTGTTNGTDCSGDRVQMPGL
ncbi:aspartyl protease family protein [Maricaulis sp.]|uniref:aspartyl protease family protein n=1 Tax=Maricaulis sp. TaxID=1486257 RepID=UPI0025B7E640|nr:aspartyl protease family protein [Maricaulis sp.]